MSPRRKRIKFKKWRLRHPDRFYRLLITLTKRNFEKYTDAFSKPIPNLDEWFIDQTERLSFRGVMPSFQYNWSEITKVATPGS